MSANRKFLTGNEARFNMKVDFVSLLERSGIPYIEIWDVDMVNQLISVHLSPDTKGRYYFRIGYLAVYKYTDDKMTYLERYSSYRLDPATSMLKPFDPYVKEMNHILRTLESNFIHKYLGIPVGEEKARVMYLHSLPPFTEDESDLIISQEGVTVYSAGNPIRFSDQLISVTSFAGNVYVSLTPLYSYVYPTEIVSATGSTVTRQITYRKTDICKIENVNMRHPGFLFVRGGMQIKKRKRQRTVEEKALLFVKSKSAGAKQCYGVEDEEDEGSDTL